MKLDVRIQPQPNDYTCGPTSLHAVYQFYEKNIQLDDIRGGIQHLEDGATMAVLLANHALKRNYKATIYTCNLSIWDPTWRGLPKSVLSEKLRAQMEVKPHDQKLQIASRAYLEYLEMGGKVKFDPVTPRLIKNLLNNGTPVLAGLSATYLYQMKREISDENWVSTYDDVRGNPLGHFVVLCGLDHKKVLIADPWHENPLTNDTLYHVNMNILINAIHLGAITYDANLLIITPKKVNA